MSANTQESGPHFPVKRIIIIALTVFGGLAAFGVLGSVFTPLKPPVILEPELVTTIFGIEVRNSMTAVLIVDIIVLLLGFTVWQASRNPEIRENGPRGLYNVVEALLEYWWNTAKESAGVENAKRIFPWVATIFLLVFFANITKLLPGFESFGWFEPAHGDIQGYEPVTLIDGTLYALDPAQPSYDAHADDGHGEEAAQGEEHHEPCEHNCQILPWLRAPATDLNFTAAIALVAVFMVQVVGVMALGPGYFSKFFPVQRFAKGFFGREFNFMDFFMGAIDIAVGFLEIISEFSKIMSFAFRLFGAIFAGTLLLLVLGALTGVAVPVVILFLELFVGAIQAYVFAILTLVFMASATISHGHGDEEHAH